MTKHFFSRILPVLTVAVAMAFSTSSFAKKTATIDLNTATEAEIEALPGVGAKAAKEIVAARPFKSVDDLKNVKGIGDKKFEKLSPLVSVGAGAAATGMAAKALDKAKSAKDAVADKAGSMKDAAADKAAAAKTAVADKAVVAKDAVAEKAATAKEVVAEKAVVAKEKMAGAAAATTAAVTGAASKAKALAAGEKININTASKADLEKLPGIGEKKAQAIIDGRPYATTDDLMKVKGIKQGIMSKIKDNIAL
jgi:competence protein ComEA